MKNINIWDKNFQDSPESYWISTIKKQKYPSLNADMNIDIAIIGGGIAGITTAYLLKQEGMKVAVIEKAQIMHSTTGHTTAKVTAQHGLIYNKLKTKLGEEKAKQYADANLYAIEFIEETIRKNSIDCDFTRCPAYVYTNDNNFVDSIEEEFRTASSLGINAAYQESIPLPFEIKAAVRFDNQARFHPLKYVNALAEKIPGDGCHIFEQTKVLNISEGKPLEILTDRNARIKADKIIIASHYPCYDGKGFYFTRLYPERSYSLGIKIKEQFPDGMFITAEDPARSLRLQDTTDGQLVIIGGEHHKTGQGEDTSNYYKHLIDFSEQNFKGVEVLYRWSTQDYSTPDHAPYTGNLTSATPNIYVTTGYGKWGMTNSTASAIILKDLITKNESPWAPVYNPSRFTPLASVKDFVSENANVVKELISGKIEQLPESVSIEAGNAQNFTYENQKVGAYRDYSNKLHIVDTTCSHMGCEVNWNSAEKSWDCPCHGSRYTYEGSVIDGPAINPINNE